jgi:hypothetical protein
LATLRELALQAWAQEQQKQRQTEQKKRKRKAKRIEADIDELLPRVSEDCQYERYLDDATYGAVVSIKEPDGELRFSHDDKDNLALLGVCAKCRNETLSKAIGRLEDLGRLLERFEPGSTHQC